MLVLIWLNDDLPWYRESVGKHLKQIHVLQPFHPPFFSTYHAIKLDHETPSHFGVAKMVILLVTFLGWLSDPLNGCL